MRLVQNTKMFWFHTLRLYHYNYMFYIVIIRAHYLQRTMFNKGKFHFPNVLVNIPLTSHIFQKSKGKVFTMKFT